MKFYKILILLTLCTQMLAQKTSISVDTLRWDNNKVSDIIKLDLLKGVISSTNYDTLGVLRGEGTYKIVDSIKCFKCLEINIGGEQVTPEYISYSNFYEIDSNLTSVIPLKFKEYDSNQKPIKVTYFEPQVYEYSMVFCPNPYNPFGSGPCASGNVVKFLIKKIEFYNSKEKIIEIEEYESGLLIQKAQFNKK